MKKYQIVLAAVLMLGPGMVSAQEIMDSLPGKTDSSVSAFDLPVQGKRNPEVSHLEAGFSYQSDNVYLGRKDSAALPYYIPVIGYYHKSGWFGSLSVDYLRNATDSRVDLVTLEAGYLIKGDKYNGQYSVSRSVHNKQSTSVTSEIKASLVAQNNYDFGWLTATFTGTLNIGSKMDAAGDFGLQHTFYLLDDALEFSPTFSATVSTQNYYNDYYRKRRYTIKRKGKKASPGISGVTGHVLNASSFKVLDYEPSLPIDYTVGKCTINFTPVYAIAVHPAQVMITSKRPDGTEVQKRRSEKIGNTFYWSLGLNFRF